LCWDGTYLYGSADAVGGSFTIRVLDPLAANPGNPISLITVTGQGTNFARALAWDPVSDHFYTGNFGSNIMEITRTGTVIRSVAPPAGTSGIYGMAWDDDSPTGPWLWVYDQVGTPQATFKRFSPVTLTFTYSYTPPLLAPNTAQIAGGAEYTTNWDPAHSTMIVMTQGTPLDRMGGYEFYLTNPLLPGPCTGFTVNNSGAALTASLAWTNPSVTCVGAPLTDLTGIYVQRDGVQIANLTPVTIGGAMNYTDNVPLVGNYQYSVIPYNTQGNGATSNGGAWIGLDMPAAPGNFTVTPVGTTLVANLAWTAPTAGAHGGYYPAGSTNGYYIYRAPQGGTMVQIGTTTGLTFTDNTAPIQGWYQYSVAGYSNSGTGNQVTPPVVVYLGPPEFQTIPYNWIEIYQVGTNTGITGDDQNLGPFPIGFNFPWYNNVTYNSIRVCSNGFASFTSTVTTFTNAAIPTTAEPNNLVAPFWDDLYPPGGGSIWYMYNAANNCFIIEWYQVVQYGTTGTPRTFELILYPNGNIDYMWHSFVGGVTNSATVGIENGTGTVGVQCSFNGGGPVNPVAQTGVRIFSVGVPPPPPNFNLTLTPINPPIVIPAIGGTFSYNVSVNNAGTATANFDIWNMVTLPAGTNFGPVWGPFVNIPLAAGATIERDRNQGVPGAAPAGVYTYRSYCGMYPGTVYDSAFFNFTKSAALDGGKMVTEWSNWGEAFPGEISFIADMPTEYSLVGAYPNPFNPTTNINFALPEKALVKLVVYDITGAEVATLVNGWIEAGAHSAVFDGSSLASGIYFCKFTAGNFSATEKMVLVK
jgi:uncharacterized repeat protein (TIGR01451 family)